MNKLQLVGPTADRDGLVLSVRQGARIESYTLVLDQALVDLVEALGVEHGLASPRRAAGRSGAGGGASALTPREIQARLRAGHTVDEVAEEAGVDASWVDRFAGPVLAEQAHAVDQAVRLTLTLPRRGPSALALADAVAAHLADRGIVAADAGPGGGWSAHHLLGSQWRLRYTFRQRGKRARAEWQVDLADGAVTAANRLGADLGYVAPGGAGPDTEGEPDRTPGAETPDEGGAAAGGVQAATGGDAEASAAAAGEETASGGEEAPGGGEAPGEDEAARREALAQQQEAARQASAAERAAEREAQRQERERERAARREAEAAARAEVRREREREREAKRQAIVAEKAVAKQAAAAARAAAKRQADEERAAARQTAAEERERRRTADLATKAAARREAAAARAAAKRAAREEAAARRTERPPRGAPDVDGQLSFEDPQADVAPAPAESAVTAESPAVPPEPPAGPAGPAAVPAGAPERAALAEAPPSPAPGPVPEADLDVPPPAWLEASGQEEELPADDDTTGWRRWRMRNGARRPGPAS